jgi:hypothetical protein
MADGLTTTRIWIWAFSGPPGSPEASHASGGPAGVAADLRVEVRGCLGRSSSAHLGPPGTRAEPEGWR